MSNYWTEFSTISKKIDHIWPRRQCKGVQMRIRCGDLSYEVLLHPSYSLYLAFNDYFLFPNLRIVERNLVPTVEEIFLKKVLM